MKVTAIKRQVKNPERVSVFVDAKYSFSLSLDELVTQKLKKDQELNQADIKRLKKISADGKLRARALEWLLNRPHSTRELRDYLYRKKADPALALTLVDEFSTKGYLEDKKYAKWLVDLRIRGGKSNRAIRSELFKKGVGRELAAEALASESDDEIVRIKAVITKKLRLSRYRKDPQKLAQYLVAQGFNWQDIKEALTLDTVE